MKENNISALPKVSPQKDKRIRVSETAKLWVLNRSWCKNKVQIEVCGVIESIERTIYRIEGENGSWVRYFDHYHPLHSAIEFSELLEAARKKNFIFFNNEITRYDVEAYDQTESSVFIYYDEIGSLA